MILKLNNVSNAIQLRHVWIEMFRDIMPYMPPNSLQYIQLISHRVSCSNTCTPAHQAAKLGPASAGTSAPQGRCWLQAACRLDLAVASRLATLQHLSYLCDAVVHQPAVCQALNKDGYYYYYYYYYSVIGHYVVPLRTYSFILTFNGNYGPILHCFRDTAVY